MGSLETPLVPFMMQIRLQNAVLLRHLLALPCTRVPARRRSRRAAEADDAGERRAGASRGNAARGGARAATRDERCQDGAGMHNGEEQTSGAGGRD